MNPTTSSVARRALVVAIALTAGCAGGGSSFSGYSAPEYVDASTSVRGVSGIGFESQDLKAMSDQMVRDILSQPQFGNAATPPRVIVDNERFVNESSQVMNMNLVLDRLRIELMRAAQGRIQFVSRQNVDLVEAEKTLKARGRVDAGSSTTSRAIAGADYRLVGKLTSQTSQARNGMRANFYQFSFEMLDLNNSLSVWGNLYDVKKAGADDRVYQ
jgi:hypothetical protein